MTTKNLVVVASAMLSTSLMARDLTEQLWFHADFDSPTTVAGEVFPFAMPTNYVQAGKFGNGYRFTCPPNGKPNIAFNRGDSRNGNCFTTSDPRLMASFPCEEGSFACWLKCDLNASTNSATPLFSNSGWWKCNWTLDRNFFSTSDKRGARHSRGYKKYLFPRRADWMHVACTWNKDLVAVYVDGVAVVTNRPVELQKMEKSTLRIGSGMQATGAAEGVMDEIAIFKVALTPDEVKALAAAKAPLREPQWMLGGVDFTVFFRNQENAALRTVVNVPVAGRCTVAGKIGSVEIPAAVRELPAGDSPFAVPFDPSRFRPGKYPWSFTVTPEKGKAIVRSGELEIRGRFDRDAFRFHSWGPDGTLAYNREMGFNQMMTYVSDIATTRNLIDAGLFVNYRIENSGAWRKYNSDWNTIRENVRRQFAYADGLYPWRSTLVNSEVYGQGTLASLTNHVPFLKSCEKAIGQKPVIAMTSRPPQQLDRKAQGKGPLHGIFDPNDEPDYATFKWFAYHGHPTVLLNGVNREAIHAVDPANTVWSEPSFGGIGATIDMFADWNYRYSATETLWEYRTQYASARPYGIGFQPTLSSGYYHGSPGPGFYPDRVSTKGKPVPCGVTQSADECAIKAMCALGAVKTETLSWFAASDWFKGEIAATNYLAGGTNTYKVIADADVGKRFGAFMQRRFFPIADLLREMETVRAPIAYVVPYASWVAGGLGWGHYHYNNAYKSVLAKGPVPFDVLADGEFTAENLAKYKLIFLSTAMVMEKQQDAALRAAAKSGARIVTDGYACTKYEGGVALTNVVWNYYKQKTMMDPVKAFCREAMPALAKTLGASSQGDGDTAFTFEKEYDGIRYVMVVNDLRKPHDAADGLLTKFCTNVTYRPYGAPQRIVTTLRNVPKGAAIYEYCAEGKFELAGEGSERTLTADYAAADAHVYAIYPRPLKAPELEVVKTVDNVSALKVRIRDVDGKLAHGRTVVAVKVTDPDGRVTDETGRYRVENGAIDIPIRFADGDPQGGFFFSRWKAEVKDLTTGETETISFRR